MQGDDTDTDSDDDDLMSDGGNADSNVNDSDGIGGADIRPISESTDVEPVVPNRDRWFDTGDANYLKSVAQLKEFLEHIKPGSTEGRSFLHAFVEAAVSGPVVKSWLDLGTLFQLALWKVYREKQERESWNNLMNDIIVATFVLQKNPDHEFIYLFNQVQPW